MSLTGENLWMAQVGGLGLILALYGAKAVLLRPGEPAARAARLYIVAVLFCIPAVWVLFPDETNSKVSPIAIYVGGPIALLTVPSLSFARDLIYLSNSGQCLRWRRRAPFEIFLGVPIWFLFWWFVEIVLGWVRL